MRRGTRTTWALGAGAGAAAAGGVLVGAAAYALRVLLTPERDRLETARVLGVGDDHVLLAADPDTTAPGRYGLWFDHGAGHARLGEIIGHDLPAGVVSRVLEGVDVGTLREGPARWNGYYFGPDPAALGIPVEHVTVPGPVGDLPTWLFPAPPGSPRADHWAVLVHGRGATRGETLRAVRPLRDLGWTVLVPSYRNDREAPPSPAGRYALGLTEWEDVEAALTWAQMRGARSYVLGGWSMGGAIVLQAAARTAFADRLSGLLLDGPVVDWGDVLNHHVALGHLPGVVTRTARRISASPMAPRLIGSDAPLDLAETNWADRAAELAVPTLLIHSRDDAFVPVGPSRALAAARPDLVRFEEWTVAAHTREWNTDPRRWERVVDEFVRTLV